MNREFPTDPPRVYIFGAYTYSARCEFSGRTLMCACARVCVSVCVCVVYCSTIKEGRKKFFRSLTLSSSPPPRQRYDVCRTDQPIYFSHSLQPRWCCPPSRSLFLPPPPSTILKTVVVVSNSHYDARSQ